MIGSQFIPPLKHSLVSNNWSQEEAQTPPSIGATSLISKITAGNSVGLPNLQDTSYWKENPEVKALIQRFYGINLEKIDYDITIDDTQIIITVPSITGSSISFTQDSNQIKTVQSGKDPLSGIKSGEMPALQLETDSDPLTAPKPSETLKLFQDKLDHPPAEHLDLTSQLESNLPEVASASISIESPATQLETTDTSFTTSLDGKQSLEEEKPIDSVGSLVYPTNETLSSIADSKTEDQTLSESQASDSLLVTTSESQVSDSLLVTTSESQASDSLLATTSESQASDSLLVTTSESQASDSLLVTTSESQASDSLLVTTSESQASDSLLATTSESQASDSVSIATDDNSHILSNPLKEEDEAVTAADAKPIAVSEESTPLVKSTIETDETQTTDLSNSPAIDGVTPSAESAATFITEAKDLNADSVEETLQSTESKSLNNESTMLLSPGEVLDSGSIVPADPVETQAKLVEIKENQLLLLVNWEGSLPEVEKITSLTADSDRTPDLEFQPISKGDLDRLDGGALSVTWIENEQVDIEALLLADWSRESNEYPEMQAFLDRQQSIALNDSNTQLFQRADLKQLYQSVIAEATKPETLDSVWGEIESEDSDSSTYLMSGNLEGVVSSDPLWDSITDWRVALNDWMLTVPEEKPTPIDLTGDGWPGFESGVFTVGETGQISVDFLFNGGAYQGEVAFFNLAGMEDLEFGSPAFVAEAARRSLSHSELGHVVLSESDRGAKFTGELGEANWNFQPYRGVATFEMQPGDRFGAMLVPNNTVQNLLHNPAQPPIFSLTPTNSTDPVRVVDLTGDGHTLGWEDLRRPIDGWTDDDFNDIIFKVQGAQTFIPPLGSLVDSLPQWLDSPLGQAIVNYADPNPSQRDFEFATTSQPLVGSIGTGLSGNNPDLDYSRILLGRDWVDGDRDPLLKVGEGNEQGTHLAGLIGATQDNGIGINGLNDRAPLWIGRATGSGQWSESLREFVDTAKQSGQPNAVVNLTFDLVQVNADGSVTTRYYLTQEELAALEYARQNGVLIVVPAGDGGGVMSALGQVSQEFDNLVVVGAAEGRDRAAYSNQGYGLTLVAPGGTTENPILSTVGDGLGTLAGTNVAAAYATGAISQIWAANPQLSYQQVIEILKKTATDLSEAGWDLGTGAGLVNIAAAVNLALATQPQCYSAPPAIVGPGPMPEEGQPRERQPGQEGESNPDGQEVISIAGTRPYQVQPGDTPWTIAQQQLGDGDRWSEIIKCDGNAFQKADEALQPGQIVHLPIIYQIGDGRPVVPPPSLTPIHLDPPSVEASTQRFYLRGETFQLTGKAFDRQGWEDINRIDFWLQQDDGEWIDISDVSQFTPDGKGWARFNYELPDLTAGRYQLKAIAYDQTGQASPPIFQDFTFLSTPETQAYSDAVRFAIERSIDLESYGPELFKTADQWVVSIKTGVDPEALAAKFGAIDVKPGILPGTWIWVLPDPEVRKDIVKQMGQEIGIEFCYPLRRIPLIHPLNPSNPIIKDQWHLYNTGQTGGTPGVDVNVFPVWNISLAGNPFQKIQGDNQLIAIVDDGIDAHHPDLESYYRAEFSHDFNSLVGNGKEPQIQPRFSDVFNLKDLWLQPRFSDFLKSWENLWKTPSFSWVGSLDELWRQARFSQMGAQLEVLRQQPQYQEVGTLLEELWRQARFSDLATTWENLWKQAQFSELSSELKDLWRQPQFSELKAFLEDLWMQPRFSEFGKLFTRFWQSQDTSWKTFWQQPIVSAIVSWQELWKQARFSTLGSLEELTKQAEFTQISNILMELWRQPKFSELGTLLEEVWRQPRFSEEGQKRDFSQLLKDLLNYPEFSDLKTALQDAPQIATLENYLKELWIQPRFSELGAALEDLWRQSRFSDITSLVDLWRQPRLSALIAWAELWGQPRFSEITLEDLWTQPRFSELQGQLQSLAENPEFEEIGNLLEAVWSQPRFSDFATTWEELWLQPRFSDLAESLKELWRQPQFSDLQATLEELWYQPRFSNLGIVWNALWYHLGFESDSWQTLWQDPTYSQIGNWKELWRQPSFSDSVIWRELWEDPNFTQLGQQLEKLHQQETFSQLGVLLEELWWQPRFSDEGIANDFKQLLAKYLAEAGLQEAWANLQKDPQFEGLEMSLEKLWYQPRFSQFNSSWQELWSQPRFSELQALWEELWRQPNFSNITNFCEELWHQTSILGISWEELWRQPQFSALAAILDELWRQPRFSDDEPLPLREPNKHGTATAGMSIGVAPGSDLGSLKLINGDVTDEQIANTLSYFNQIFDVYNNSWKPGEPLIALPASLYGIEDGAMQGRGGLGSNFVFAAGNDGWDGGNVNLNGFANSIRTIAVAAIDHNGKQAWYSEPGAALLVSAPSSSAYFDEDGNIIEVGISTLDLPGDAGFNKEDNDRNYADGNYTNNFGGTSAAAPLVSGLIALMLEANPQLSQRDIQHILVETARKTDPEDKDWVQNAAGYWVNYKYGFGAIDTEAAVKAAISWNPVDAEVSVKSAVQHVNEVIPDNNPGGISSTINVDEDINIEWVEVMFDATHPWRGDLKVVLISPDGTESVLVNPHYDSGDNYQMMNNESQDYRSWTFTSARHWGESSQGEWTLKVSDMWGNEVGNWNNWKLNFYGTQPLIKEPPKDFGSLMYVNPANNHLYFSSEPDSWAGAKAQGEKAGGYLVAINDAAEQDWLIQQFGQYGYIGLTDSELYGATEGNFKWLSGEPFTYSNWSPGEPNNHQITSLGEDVVSVSNTPGGMWNDFSEEYYNDQLGLKWPGVIEIDPSKLDGTVIKITAIDPEAAENSNNGEFLITRLGDVTQDLVVTYAVGGNATIGTDYTGLTGTITIPAGQASAKLTILPLNDNQDEGDETVEVILADRDTYRVGTASSATVTIADNDEAVVTIAATNANATENGTEGQFVITRMGGDTTKPLTVQYSIAGTATQGTDYQPLVGTVTIPAGETTATLSVIPIKDYEPEGNETVIVTLTDTASYDLGGNTNAQVTIANNLNLIQTYTEGMPLNLTDIVVTDSDNQATVTLKLSNPNAGTLITGTSNTVTSTYDPTAGEWKASGTVADINTLLANLQFIPANNFNEDVTIAINITDVADPISGTLDLIGQSVNYTPTLEIEPTRILTREVGSTGYDTGNDVAVDSAGNFYLAGWVRGDVDGNPYVGGPGLPGGLGDSFLTKYDVNGDKQWTRTLGSTGDESFNGVTTDDAGNVYVVGQTNGSLNGQTALGDYDAFFAKYDTDGNLLWVRQFGTTGSDYLQEVVTDGQGNFYAVGGDGDGNSIFKFDSDGNILWKRSLAPSVKGLDIAIDPATNKVYIVGQANGAIAGVPNAGNKDGFVAQYDSEGNLIWVEQLQTSAEDVVHGIDLDSSGNVYISGYTSGSLAGNTNIGGIDGFVAKYTSNGDRLWVNQFGNAGNDYIWDVAVDANSNVVATGFSEATLGTALWDGSIVGFDTYGNRFSWNQQVATAGWDFITAITFDENNDFYAAGSVSGSIDGQPHAGSLEPIVMKYRVTQSYTPNTPLDLKDMVIRDGDPEDIVTVSLTLSDPNAGALTTGTSGNVTATFNNGVWEASGSVADINALLANIQFIPATDFTGEIALTSSVTDSHSAVVTSTITLKSE